MLIKGLKVIKKPSETYLVVRESDGDRELTATECELLEKIANMTRGETLEWILAGIDFDGADPNTFDVAELRAALP